jgi:CRP/FNR family transcriptional regulator, dissimilatory nitrate respiration regulator
MVPVNKTQIIAHSSVFGTVSGPRQAQLADMSRIVDYSKGHVIFRQDDEVPGMYIVVTGLVRLYKIAPNGKEHTLHLAAPSQTFAEVAAIAGFPCPAWAEAVENTSALLLPTASLTQMLRQDHALCLELLAGMGTWVRHLTNLLEDIVLRDSASRVARLLLASPRDESQVCSLPGLRKHLASQLNLTAETLSRTLHRFNEAGHVQILADQRIRIRDLPALAALCGSE